MNQDSRVAVKLLFIRLYALYAARTSTIQILRFLHLYKFYTLFGHWLYALCFNDSAGGRIVASTSDTALTSIIPRKTIRHKKGQESRHLLYLDTSASVRAVLHGYIATM
jgi:hypothetical protein